MFPERFRPHVGDGSRGTRGLQGASQEDNERAALSSIALGYSREQACLSGYCRGEETPEGWSTRTQQVGRRAAGGRRHPSAYPALNPVSVCLSFFPPHLPAAPMGWSGQSSAGTGGWAQRRHGQVTPRYMRSAAQRDPRRPPRPAGERRGGVGWAGRQLGKVPIPVGQGQCSECRGEAGEARTVSVDGCEEKPGFPGAGALSEDPPCTPGDLR